MRKRDIKQIALAILVLTVCLFSLACALILDPSLGPAEIAGYNLTLDFFYGYTYGTSITRYPTGYKQNGPP
ncbi:MAG: hypothetical protein ABSB86_20020, partial [Bryobacteraceae bacterium]